MAYNLIPVEREQQYLMPPSLRQWLPQYHLAWFVLDTVESLDLKGFYANRRDDGWGRAAYHPKMMVAVLLYAYATCTRSSRKIERALIEDIAFRVLSPLFANLVDAAEANLEAAGGAAIGTVLADAGYLSLDNVNLDVSCELLIAPAAHSRRNSVEPYDRGEQNRYKTRIQELEMEAELRVGVLDELIAGDLLLKEVAERLGMTIPGVWALKQRYLADDRDGVYRRLPAAPKGPSARQIMAEKLSSDKARRTYDLRSAIVEPVFGHIKWVRALTRFRRRGLEACTTEWKLEAIAHNLLKLWRSSCSSKPCFGL